MGPADSEFEVTGEDNVSGSIVSLDQCFDPRGLSAKCGGSEYCSSQLDQCEDAQIPHDFRQSQQDDHLPYCVGAV